ncbi:hypothetical protein PoB_002529200 [Plakobranchus ocellatus]|uniref:Uncharacterized protein n=1 Tax=Plakobranchus ocellatus TaxID=259542 RepID=A0AAV3ZVV4_9GAST|nr:hypothetical protein PoB_002529200 [Plakobranchus ocellatus]
MGEGWRARRRGANGNPDNLTVCRTLGAQKRECENIGGVGGTVDSESTLRSAGTLLSRVRAPSQAPWCDRGPESLDSPCYGLAVYKPPNFPI